MNLDQQLAAYAQAIQDGDDTKANAILAAVDHQQQQDEARLTAPDALHNAATWYASVGVAVFPLKPDGKTPATKNGFKDATLDPDQIRAWWTANPQANIGLPTGRTFDVVDIDGPTGYMSLSELGDIPYLARAITPRGLHIYVNPVDQRGNKAAIHPGIDYRGLGGYVVAPPSRVAGKRYSWAIQPTFMTP